MGAPGQTRLLWQYVRRYVTTFGGFREPRSILARFVPDFQTESLM